MLTRSARPDDLQTQSITNIESCHNQYQGPVFIVASGASAAHFPITEFAHVPMITMNGAISTFLQANIKPLFYVCTDAGFPVQQAHLFNCAMQHAENVIVHGREFKSLPQTAGKLFLIEKSKRPSLIKRICYPKQNLRYALALFSQRKNAIGFSKNLSEGWVDARTVAYVALQLAYHLGFNTVIMVGFDLNTSQPRFYEREGLPKSPIGLDNHYEKRILPCLKFMRKHIVCQKFSAYNLSDASKVPSEVIPKISLDTLRLMLANAHNTPAPAKLGRISVDL